MSQMFSILFDFVFFIFFSKSFFAHSVSLSLSLSLSLALFVHAHTYFLTLFHTHIHPSLPQHTQCSTLDSIQIVSLVNATGCMVHILKSQLAAQSTM